MSGDINFGAISEELNNKADLDLANLPDNYDFVVEWQNIGTGNRWYRKYKSGWVEQGGYVSGSGSATVTLPVKMATATYTITLGNTSGTYEQVLQYGQTVNGFSLKNANGGGAASCYWHVAGMAA